MKYTLLELVQTVLSSLDSDEVNSINDTVESQQVSKIIKTVYGDIIARAGLLEHYEPFELTASGEDAKPVLMYRPDRVRHMEWLKYNKTDTANSVTVNFQMLRYVPPRDFTNMMHSLSTAEDSVGSMSITINGDAITFLYKNDKHPEYYTTYDDYMVIFDAYNSDEDTTLQKSKTLGYGEIVPAWTESDAFTPDLDEKQFALLLNEAKVLAFAELKQAGHAVAAGNARKQWISMRKDKSMIPADYFNQLPNYGRK